MSIGKNQLDLLMALGSPSVSLVVPNKESRSLVKRGLLKAEENGAFACITPAGLRLLAEELEHGRIPDALENIKRDVEKRNGVTLPQPNKE